MARRKPTYHDDLEEVMQNAYGRRFLQRLFAMVAAGGKPEASIRAESARAPVAP